MMRSEGLLLGSELPIVGAPMAGGAGGVRLGAAVAAAGEFPFLAGGYQSVEAVAEEIAEARRWGRPFGVNLFVPGRADLDEARLCGVRRADQVRSSCVRPRARSGPAQR